MKQKPNQFLRVWLPTVLTVAAVCMFFSRGKLAERALQGLAAGSVTYMVSASLAMPAATKPKDDERE